MKRGALLGVVVIAVLGSVAGSANAAAPTPDPPPLAVAPETPEPAPDPKPARATRQSPANTRSVAIEAPVVTPTVTTPAVVTQETPVQPAPKGAAAKRPARAAARPKREQVTATPPERTHDRPLLQRPAAAVAVAVDELDRGALALAGGGLAFVALGGAVLLLATRRQLEALR